MVNAVVNSSDSTRKIFVLSNDYASVVRVSKNDTHLTLCDGLFSAYLFHSKFTI